VETLGKIVCAVWVIGCGGFSLVRLGGADTGVAFVVGPPVIADRDLPDVPRPAPGKPRAVSFYADRYGQFWITGTANGIAFRFLADTGASGITFSTRDARRLGLDVNRLRWDGRASTANGIVRTAPARLERLEVGPFTLADVPVSINEGDLEFPLLGMAFLRRLNLSIGNGTLTLTGEP
jgi:clan AA aspartic protease (TIGR02281 family)